MLASLRGIGGSSRVGYRLLICSSMARRMSRVRGKRMRVQQDDLDG